MRQGTRKIRNKKSGQVQIQYAHLHAGLYIFIPLNDKWEVVKD